MKIPKKVVFSLLIFFIASISFAQVSVCSWNLMNFGKSKSDSELEFIAKTINSFDIIAIQEVVAGEGGAQAVSRLVTILNTKGFKWDYSISHPTSSENPASVERYAFIWKPSKVKKLGDGWLEPHFEKEIDREPYLAHFEYQGKSFTLAAFHAVPKSKNPEHEIKYFKLLPDLYPKQNLIFMGDFNCPQSNEVFTPLKKKGFSPVLVSQKTSLKQKCNVKSCLASEYDNVFYDAQKNKALKSGVILFYESFPSLKEARQISDHIPVWTTFQLN